MGNIYQVCMSTVEKAASVSGITATFVLREVSLKSIFKVLGRKIIFYACVYNKFTSKKSLVISPHAWLMHKRLPKRIAF